MKHEPKQPTTRGLEKYPDTDGYWVDGPDDKTPCTCKPDCNETCKGECGCEACMVAYSDYLSSQFD